MLVTLELPDDAVDLSITLIRNTGFMNFNVSAILVDLPEYDRVAFKDDGKGSTTFDYHKRSDIERRTNDRK